MGKLTITGKASHEYSYDLMEITVRFQAHEQTSAASMEKVLAQCEEFLSLMHEEGISADSIRIGDNSVDQEYDDKELDVCTTREVKMRLPFDMEFTNYIMSLLQEKQFDVDIDTEYLLSRKIEIHNSLIKEAIEDSKSKASFIVDAMGQKLIGIDSVEIEQHYGSRIDYMCCEEERPRRACFGALPHSNKLKSPVTEEYESVEVVWLIE